MLLLQKSASLKPFHLTHILRYLMDKIKDFISAVHSYSKLRYGIYFSLDCLYQEIQHHAEPIIGFLKYSETKDHLETEVQLQLQPMKGNVSLCKCPLSLQNVYHYSSLSNSHLTLSQP